MTASSVLEFSGPGFAMSEWSLRGVKADLTHIQQAADLQRDINGTMIDLSEVQFRKYAVSLSCDDHESPGFAEISSAGAGIWPGAAVTITLLPQLGAAAALMLDLVVVAWRESRDEYNCQTAWQLDLEQE